MERFAQGAICLWSVSPRAFRPRHFAYGVSPREREVNLSARGARNPMSKPHENLSAGGAP